MNSFKKYILKPFRSILSYRFSRSGNNLTSKLLYYLAQNVNPLNGINLGPNVGYLEKYSKHRMILPIYDLEPNVHHSWVSPNATIIGEVTVGNYTSVWNNVVIRGDLNGIYIGTNSIIGDGTVITTASSLPTGLPGKTNIGITY